MEECMTDVKIGYSVRGKRGELYLKGEWAILDEFCTLSPRKVLLELGVKMTAGIHVPAKR